MKNQVNYTLLFWVVNLGLAILKILFALRPEIDAFTEEAQYWLWSRNLDWQYYSKPPMVAVLNFLSTAIAGHSELGIRLVPTVLGIFSAGIIFSFTKNLYKSAQTAFWAGLIFLGMPITFLGFTFHTTDTSMTFFWILAWFALYKAIHSEDKKSWILAGLATALGILSKNTMLFIFLTALIYLIATGSLKKQLSNFLLFALVSLLGFLPGIIWNFQHDFYTFKHIAALGGAGGEPKPFDFGLLIARTTEYFGGQLAMVSVFFLPFFYLGFKKLWKDKDKTSFFNALPGLMTFLFFGALSFFSWILVNWPGFAFSTFAVFLAPLVSSLSPRWKKYRNVAMALSLGAMVLIYLPNLGSWKSSGPIYPAEKALFKRMLGYDDLGKRVQALADSLGGGNPIVFSESYHTASELALYMPSHPQTLVINMGSRKNQWDLWPGMDLQVGNTGRFIFVSRVKESPEEVAVFGKLIYGEELPFYFGKDSIGKSKIQVWEHLLEYNPVDLGTF